MGNGTKLLGFLQKPAIRGIIKSIPFVGELGSNILTETANSPSGKVDKQDLVPTLIRMGVVIVLLYLAMSGKISFDDAEQAKDFLD